MPAEILTIAADGDCAADVRRAAEALSAGRLVAFPTETVYGLAANAAVAEGVERLRDLKGRAGERPFTVHIGRRGDCDRYVNSLSPLAQRLIRKGWPGPLTFILPVEDPARAEIHAQLCPVGAQAIYSGNTVGVRFPNHPVAAALLAESAGPIIASSANLAGSPPPTEAAAIDRRLLDRLDFVLDAGPSRFKQASTIVELNGSGYHIVRKGVVTDEVLRAYAAVSILFVCTGNTCRSPMAEGILRNLLALKLGCSADDVQRRGVRIVSAGTLSVGGAPPSPEAVRICDRRGIDITRHRSRGLDVDLIRSADYIYTMAGHHLEVVRSLCPADASRSARLDPDQDIADPVGGTEEDYERAAQRISEALSRRLGEIIL